MTRKLQQSLIQQKRRTEQVNQQIPGILGLALDGQRRVEVPNRNAFVFVRLRNNQSEVIQAYNNKVAPAYNLPVLVERNGGRYEVVGIDTQSYENNWNSYSAFLPKHGNTHSFDPETGGGGDVVWVHERQFMPALVLPSGSVGAGNLIVSRYTLQNSDGTWKYVGNTGTASITQHRPSSPTGAIMGLVYLDASSGNPSILINSGTVFLNSLTGSSQIYPYIPTVTNPSIQIPLAAVRLITGTSKLVWDNIYDVRQFIHTTPTGTGGGGSGIDTIGIAGQDEGVNVGTGTVLNVTGAGATLTRSGSVLNLDVSGGGSGLGVVQEYGNFVVSGTAINFIGMDVSSSGSIARVSSLDGPQGFGYNYRINSVSGGGGVSGTFAVALQTPDGSNPSSTNPLIFRIDNTRRFLDTSAILSLPTGTNLMNAGGAELAGREFDAFVYVIWDSSAEAVKHGISRIPWGIEMGDFSTDPTSERHIFSNVSAFNLNDKVENIGRIRLTHSSPTGYWIAAEPFISNPMQSTDWLDYTPANTGSFSSVTTQFGRYRVNGPTLDLRVIMVGTSNATAFRTTSPFRSKNTAGYYQYGSTGFYQDNGTSGGPGLIETAPGGNTMDFFRTGYLTWTALGTKAAYSSHSIEM